MGGLGPRTDKKALQGGIDLSKCEKAPLRGLDLLVGSREGLNLRKGVGLDLFPYPI